MKKIFWTGLAFGTMMFGLSGVASASPYVLSIEGTIDDAREVWYTDELDNGPVTFSSRFIFDSDQSKAIHSSNSSSADPAFTMAYAFSGGSYGASYSLLNAPSSFPEPSHSYSMSVLRIYNNVFLGEELGGKAESGIYDALVFSAADENSSVENPFADNPANGSSMFFYLIAQSSWLTSEAIPTILPNTAEFVSSSLTVGLWENGYQMASAGDDQITFSTIYNLPLPPSPGMPNLPPPNLPPPTHLPVPIPAPIFLLGSALVALFGARRKKNV